MAVRTAGQLRPVNSTICITPYCFLCNRITCLRRSCSSARLCLRASPLIGKLMNCVATAIKISLGRVYKQWNCPTKHHNCDERDKRDVTNLTSGVCHRAQCQSCKNANHQSENGASSACKKQC